MSEAIEVKVARLEEKYEDTARRVATIEEQTAKIPNMCSDMCCIAKDIQSILKSQESAGRSLDRVEDKFDKQIEQTNSRVETLEGQPAERWNTMTKTIFTVVVSALAGGFMALLSTVFTEVIK